MKLATPSLLAVAAAVVGAAAMRPDPVAAPPPPVVETVAMASASFGYRLPGEYLGASGAVDAPVRTMVFPRGLEIMKYQVSAADYGRCVADGLCEPAAGRSGSADLPVTGVNYQDARNYAAWLSRATGETWRLPTDAEWTYAAGERFRDEPLGATGDAGNPAARWLSRYRLEARIAAPDPQPKPRGAFGTNDRGVADIAGNVWDWTSSCYVRSHVGAGGALKASVENCGIHVVGGRHRAYMPFFIRDGRSGGCAAGLPPDNLGIRLVREPPTLTSRLRALLPTFG